MSSPSHSRPDISAEAAAMPRPALTAPEARALRHLRRLDRGDGCRETMEELAKALQPAKPLSERQMSRLVASLLVKGCIESGGRVGGNRQRILHVSRRPGGQS